METKETSQLAGKAYEDSDNTVVHQLKRIIIAQKLTSMVEF